MNARPSPLRRQTQKSSPCVVTIFVAGEPQQSITLPYTSRERFERDMERRAEHCLTQLKLKARC